MRWLLLVNLIIGSNGLPTPSPPTHISWWQSTIDTMNVFPAMQHTRVIARLKEKVQQGSIQHSYELGNELLKKTAHYNEEGAIQLLQAAAAGGQLDAQLQLGHIYETGKFGMATDKVTASKWYANAGQNGNSEAIAGLSRLAKDKVHGKKAEEYLNAISQAKVVSEEIVSWPQVLSFDQPLPSRTWSQYLYDLTHWPSSDMQQARMLAHLREMSHQESPVHQYQLANMLLQKYGRYNEAGAFQLLQHSAKNGYGDAQLKLALVYENGYFGIPKDLSKAVKWYSMASSNGKSSASAALKRLASGGDIYAQLSAAHLAIRTRSMAEAEMWLKTAVKSGSEVAEIMLIDLESVPTRKLVFEMQQADNGVAEAQAKLIKKFKAMKSKKEADAWYEKVKKDWHLWYKDHPEFVDQQNMLYRKDIDDLYQETMRQMRQEGRSFNFDWDRLLSLAYSWPLPVHQNAAAAGLQITHPAPDI